MKALLPQIALTKSFRNSYQYTNILYLFQVVQEIIEKFSGLKFAAFMEEKLFKQIGVSARLGLDPELTDQMIQGHVLDEETFSTIRTIAFSCYPHVHMAAGGVVASPLDVCKWIQAQLGHIPLFPKSRMKYLWRPQTVISDNEFYGLGWCLLTHKPQRIVSHGGLLKGIRHLLYMVPEHDFGIFVLTNLTHSEAPLRICEFATDLLMGLAPVAPDPFARKAYLDSLKVDCPAPTCDIGFESSNYLGCYTNPILQRAEIVIQDNQLIMLLGKKPAVAMLEPIAKDEFRIFFISDSGADIAEGHWGTASFADNALVLLIACNYVCYNILGTGFGCYYIICATSEYLACHIIAGFVSQHFGQAKMFLASGVVAVFSLLVLIDEGEDFGYLIWRKRSCCLL